IGASAFPPSFNNNGDSVGIWSSFESYNGRNFDNAIVNLDYTSLAQNLSGGEPSIYWTGTGDSNNIANWATSAVGVAGAYESRPSFIGPTPGERLNADDVGSPGSFTLSGTVASTDPLVFTELMIDPSSNLGGDE